MLRSVPFIVCLSIVTFFAPASSSATGDLPLDLAAIIEEALINNPELNAARSNIEALEQRPDQAAALPDPMISLGLMSVPVDTFDLAQEAMTQKTIGISQSFPYPGKLGLKREIAERDVISGREGLEALKLRVIKEIKTAYYALFFTGKAIEITERNKNLLEEFVRIAATKYSVGSGVQQDVLKAQVELSKLLERLISLSEERETLKAQLNSLMNRMPQAMLGEPGEVKLTSVEIDLDALQKEAQNRHPLLRGILASIERSSKAHLLSKKEYYPDFNVSVQYGLREDGSGMKRADLVSAMVNVKVPLWYRTKDDKKVAEMASRITQMEHYYARARSMLFFRITKLREEIGRNYEQALLFRDGIIPQATASLDSAVAGYQVNKVDFLTLINNQITLFNYEVQYYKTITGHESKLAEMEEAAGSSIADWGLRTAESEIEVIK